MKRIALIANPNSGQGAAERVGDLLRAGGAEVESFAIGEASGAAEPGFGRIVVAGGDGSIGTAAGIAGAAGIPLAVIATGTANDFAAHRGLPMDLEAACRLAFDGQVLRRMELAKVDGRSFVNVASAGLAPLAAEGADALKPKLGALAYPVGAVGAGLSAEPISCGVSVDGENLFEGAAWQVSIASGGAFGGGSTLAADPTDGLLDLIVIESGSRARLAKHALGLRLGAIEDQSGVISRRGAEVELKLKPEATINVDGELIAVGELAADSLLNFSAERDGFDLVVG